MDSSGTKDTTQKEEEEEESKAHNSLASDPEYISPFNPTNEEAQEATLRLLKLKENDVLFDLGCGDARILQTAVKKVKGLRCVGIDIDEVFLQRAIQSISEFPEEQQQRRIDIRKESCLKQSPAEQATIDKDSSKLCIPPGIDPNNVIGSECKDLSLFNDATAVYLYLLPKALVQVKKILDGLLEYRKNQEDSKPLQVVAYIFQVRGWEPTLVDKSTKAGVPLYLYNFS